MLTAPSSDAPHSFQHPLIRRLISPRAFGRVEGATFSHKGRRDGARNRPLFRAARNGYGFPMPHTPVPPPKRAFARSLRREPTDAESFLWKEVRGRRFNRIKFRRQVPVPPYVADFLCTEAMLIIEVDGGQHGESVSDEARTRFLKARGFRVLRFWNEEVLREIDAVCDTIIAYVRDPSLQPWR